MRSRILLSVLTSTLFLFLVPSPASADVRVPAGWTTVAAEELAPGLTHLHLTRSEPAQSVHVAVLRPGAGLALRTVVSDDVVSGRLERTSSMCRRVSCLAAVNGDFFHPDGTPVGALVRLGELVRSPSTAHHQAVVGSNGALATGTMQWSAAVGTTDLMRYDIGAVNQPRGDDGLVLYTPAFGPTTATNPFGVEVTGSIVEPPGGVVRVGQTAVVRLTGIHKGQPGVAIPAAGVVLSGHGAGARALEDLWRRTTSGSASQDVLMRVDTAPRASESVGGTPVLVREGRRWFADEASAFARGRHPRTIVGRTAAGETLLVTVDGRQRGTAEGMSLAEASDLMIALGSTDALNLDGGGSTTFAIRGEVANRPSDRIVRRDGGPAVAHTGDGTSVLGHVERPVTVALAIVPVTTGPAAPVPLSPIDLDLPQALPEAPPPQRTDPASDPTRAAAPLMETGGEDGGARTGVYAAAVLALSLALLLAWDPEPLAAQRLRSRTDGVRTSRGRTDELPSDVGAGATEATGASTGVSDGDAGTSTTTSERPSPSVSSTETDASSTTTASETNGT